jgi:Leucine-rich repeat (LRR) protein
MSQTDWAVVPCLRDLSGLSLDGELPFDTSVWQPLNTLTSVNLSNNNLSGFLPPQISELTNATTLNLGGNSFSGGTCWLAAWQPGVPPL